MADWDDQSDDSEPGRVEEKKAKQAQTLEDMREDVVKCCEAAYKIDRRSSSDWTQLMWRTANDDEKRERELAIWTREARSWDELKELAERMKQRMERFKKLTEPK
jgi:hypothetical protein